MQAGILLLESRANPPYNAVRNTLSEIRLFLINRPGILPVFEFFTQPDPPIAAPIIDIIMETGRWSSYGTQNMYHAPPYQE
jgi:hypothetical protein